MNRLMLIAFSLLAPVVSVVAPAQAGIDASINNATAPVARWVGEVVFFKIPVFGAQLPVVVLWLIVGAVFFTFYMKFVNLRGFRHAIHLVRGDYADPKSAGEVSHFQALATAVSGTVAIGNIGGVAVAVTVGGAGATFWLIMAGFLGMSTKFVECTLGVKYRNENPDGSVSGGPMYYLRKGFADRGMDGFGRYIGAFYAIGIFIGALTPDGVAGGALGAMIIGFQRAVFSNEAGIGSASIAHSAVRTNEPVTEGYVSLLEPFIDTIVICTITALVIGTTNVAQPGFAGDATGVAMTSMAFEWQFSWFTIPLAFAAVLFAFSTMIAWSYYGLKGWTYLFGESDKMQTTYKVIFCVFVALGFMVQLGPLLKISDAFVFLICVPNILGLFFLAPVVKREMEDYLARLESGEIKRYKN